MRYNINYAEYFEEKITVLTNYVKEYNLEALVLGISGGIDSTVCAAICHEVTKRVPVKFIGRSIPTNHNKYEETNAADLVGNAFCTDYTECFINSFYERLVNLIEYYEDYGLARSENNTLISQQTPVANGNIQARLRMIYLYNLASINKGIVIDTDNLTEHNLGYFTIHGDQGDVNPIGDLWKTQVFELAAWLASEYYPKQYTYKDVTLDQPVFAKIHAITESLKLKPTAGLGITNNDLEEIGAESYEQVDGII